MELGVQPRAGLVTWVVFCCGPIDSKIFEKPTLHEMNEETGRFLLVNTWRFSTEGLIQRILVRSCCPAGIFCLAPFRLPEIVLPKQNTPQQFAWKPELYGYTHNFWAEGRELSGVESSKFLLFFVVHLFFAAFLPSDCFPKKDLRSLNLPESLDLNEF